MAMESEKLIENHSVLVFCNNCNGCKEFCIYRSGDKCFADVIEHVLRNSESAEDDDL